ncbi:DUF4347 domain-containing protein [Lentisphaerota bacterium ZTH]|nr:DUF4347 domain-containing protein [Lentisphaerota bacterium]WET06324.1 DUF4347 domain-containing protein [Lentisphaerota bacterium ZTH]
MYKLELRVLFDAAAAADVAETVQQEEQQSHDALQEEETQNHEFSTGGADQEEAGISGDNEFEEALAEISTDNSENDINVLLISTSLANVDAITAAAEAGTIVIKYDATRTSASELLDIINQSLEGKAHSISFVADTEEGSSLHLFADEGTSGSTASDEQQSGFWQAVEEHLTAEGQVKIFAAHLLSTAEGQDVVDAIRKSLEHQLDASEDTLEAAEQDSDWLLDFSEDDADPLIETDITDNLEEAATEDAEDFNPAGTTAINISENTVQTGDIAEKTEPDNADRDDISSEVNDSFDHTDIAAGPVSFSVAPSGFALGNTTAQVSTPVSAPAAGITSSVESDLNGNINLYMQGCPHFTPFHYSTLDVNEISAFPIGRYPFFEPTQYFYPQTLVSVGEEGYDELEFYFSVNPLTNPLYGQDPLREGLSGFEVAVNAPLSYTVDFPVDAGCNGEYTVGSDWLVTHEPMEGLSVNQYQQFMTVGEIAQFYLDFSDRTTLFEKAEPFADSIDRALYKLMNR